jgi:hypothetical protein
LLMAAPLIVSLFLVDKNTSPLAGVTPMQIAIAFILLGTIGFVIRVMQYSAENRSAQDPLGKTQVEE